MNTEKLFYQDAYMQEFTAVVQSCEAAKSGYLVTLDRTAFYPEGGGQPADFGILDGVEVVDVHERDGVILHTVKAPIEVGKTVTGTIDWPRRFDHMQQHSGEHMISGLICAAHHCSNVGFHMGADVVTIDFNADMTPEDVLEAERKTNEAIWADRPTEITFPSPQELEAIDYRSKKELTGQVRIVTFPGADCCACCGTHVARAGEVGLVKVLSYQKFREGVRLEIISGKRAFDFLSTVYEQDKAIGCHLSVKPQDTMAAVERVTEELNNAKFRMTELENQLFARIAEEKTGIGDVLLVEEAMRPDGVRKLADAVAHTCGGLCAVFAGTRGKYNYALVRADGADIRPLVKAMNEALHGRGGGRNGFAQGSAAATKQEIEAFFASALPQD